LEGILNDILLKLSRHLPGVNVKVFSSGFDCLSHPSSIDPNNLAAYSRIDGRFEARVQAQAVIFGLEALGTIECFVNFR
jgi:hypothetical protein